MARVEVTKAPVVVPQQKVVSVTLHLSPEEAQFIINVVGKLSGQEWGRFGHDGGGIYGALYDAGFRVKLLDGRRYNSSLRLVEP